MLNNVCKTEIREDLFAGASTSGIVTLNLGSINNHH